MGLRVAFFCPKQLISFYRLLFKRMTFSLELKYVFEDDADLQIKDDEYCFCREKDAGYTFLNFLNVDLIIVYGWNYLMPISVMESFEVYNIHNSLLPKYRGPIPIIFQLLNDERISGVTLHKMNEHFDSGDIYKQEKFCIDERDNCKSISIKALRASEKLLRDFICDYTNNNVTVVPQDHSLSTYFSVSDINKYVVDNTYSYASFLKLFETLNNRFPVKVLINSQIRTLQEFSLEANTNSERYALDDKTIYFYLT